jgi:hypothetical protein
LHCAEPAASKIRRRGSVIIRSFASNSLSFNVVGVPGLKRTLTALSVFILLGLALISCGYTSSSNNQTRSKLKFRAFISNPLHPSQAGGGSPVLEIVDASKDVYRGFLVSLAGTVPEAGMMALSPKKDRTLVFSPSNNALGIVDNATESAAGSVTLPGATESFFVSGDNTTAFVAVPTAPVPGQPAGGVGRINLSTPAITATLPLPGAHFIAPSPSGNQILVLSDTANAVTLLAPSLIDSGNPLTPISVPGAFDKPVWAIFSSDGSTAYVLNCGPECGGSAASVAVLDMAQSPPTLANLSVANPIPVPAATVGLLQGTNLYVAGTPAQLACGSSPLSSTTCGALTVIDTSSSTAAAPILITNGYHSIMQMGSNGQLFIGARRCTNIAGSTSCLTVVNTSSGAAVSPVHTGDVTGIEPIPRRNVVYVCEGGKLRIYDTGTDQQQSTQINIVGQAIDVKVVDF